MKGNREEVGMFEAVAPGVGRLGILFVNVFALGEPVGEPGRPWLLVDAGLAGSALSAGRSRGASAKGRGPRGSCSPTATSTTSALRATSPKGGCSHLCPPARGALPHRKVGLPAARPDDGLGDGPVVAPHARPRLRFLRPRPGTP